MKLSRIKKQTPQRRHSGGSSQKPPSFRWDASARVWFCLACVLLVMSCLRGIHFPAIWAYTHFLVNYDFGFTPRGFVGAVFSALGGGYWRTYDFMLIFSSAVLFANLFLLALHLRALTASRHPIFIGCALIFAGSVAVAHLCSINGYADHLGLLTVLSCFRITNFTRKIIFAATAGAIMILIHEAFLLLFFPLLFTDLWLSTNPHKPQQKNAVAVFAVWILAVSFAVAQVDVLGEAVMQQAFAAYTDEVGIKMSIGAGQHIFVYDLAAEWKIRRHVWAVNPSGRAMLTSLLVMVPTAAVFLFAANALLRQLATPPALRWLFLSAPLSPLLLHIVAFDFLRWNGGTVINCFLLLVLVFCRRAQWVLPVPKIWLPICFLTVVIGGANLSYYEKYHLLYDFPFRQHGEYIAGWLAGVHPFLPSAPP